MGTQKVANNPLGSFPVLSDADSSGNKIQIVRLDVGSGTTLSPWTGGAGTNVTFTHTRVSIASGASTLLLAANSSRKPGSYVVNNNVTYTFYGNYGTTAAVMSEGWYVLSDGGIFLFNTTQALRAIQNSGGPLLLDVFEAT